MHYAYFFIVLVYLTSALFASEECNTDTSDWYKYHLGTKTPYRIVANTDVTKPAFKGCKAEKIWMLVRHGTRNPGDDAIAIWQSELPRIRDLILKHNSEPSELLRQSDLYNLAQWKNELTEDEEKILTHEGEYESLELAERMQTRYPELFPPTYSNSTYFFKYTDSQRTEATAKFFTAGLFGRDTMDDVEYPEPLDQDPIIEFYKLCDRWNEEVDENPETFREKILFENSFYMGQIVDSINADLNLKENPLTLEEIRLIYEVCTYETAWNDFRKSPWCSVFSREALKAMEFVEDLEYYYTDGYGTELTYKQACPAFGDMFNFLKGYTNYPQTVVYFTHSGALLKVLAHVGLYRDDEALIHTDYRKIEQRQWRVSKIGAFATNLAFVLFDCDGIKKVAAYHQERLVDLPACNDSLCSLDEISKYYSDSIYNCDFDSMCNLDE